MLRVLTLTVVLGLVFTGCESRGSQSNEQIRDLRATIAALQHADTPPPAAVAVTTVPSITPTATPTPDASPSAAAVAQPPTNDQCPVQYPIKVTGDGQAYLVGDMKYNAIRPVMCYASLRDAIAEGNTPAVSRTPFAAPIARTVMPTPMPTGTPRFVDAADKSRTGTTCPVAYPVKLTFAGKVRQVSDKDYVTAVVWRCYATVDVAMQDATPDPTASPTSTPTEVDVTDQYAMRLADFPAELGPYQVKPPFQLPDGFRYGGVTFEPIDPQTRGIAGGEIVVWRFVNVEHAKTEFPRPGEDGLIDASERIADLLKDTVLYAAPHTVRLTYTGELGADDEVQVLRTTTTVGSLAQRVVYFHAYYHYVLRHGTVTARVNIGVNLGRAEQLGAGSPVDDAPFKKQADLIVAQQLRLLQTR